MTSLRSTPWPRLLTALAALAISLLGLATLSAPAAADPGGSSLKQEIVVHSDDTVDVTYTVKVEGLDLDDYCNDEALGSSDKKIKVDVSVVGDTCVSKATGVTLSDVNDSGDVISHDGDEYTVTIDTSVFIIPDDEGEQSVSVTFPGKVTSSEPEGKVSGNTVTWTSFEGVTEVKASGKDNSGSVLLWILLGLVVLVVVIAVVVLIVLLTRGKKPKTPLSPAGGYVPGSPYSAQPGQAQPQGYQPGAPPQPGYQPPQAVPPQAVPPQPGYQPQPPQGYQPPQPPTSAY